MKTCALPLVAGCSLILCSFPLAAAELIPATPIRVAASTSDTDSSFSAKKDEYEQKARQQLDDWGKKMSSFSQEAKEKGGQVNTQTKKDLDHAWADMKRQWQHLQKTSASGWDQAQTSFEKASDKMKAEWQKVNPGD